MNWKEYCEIIRNTEEAKGLTFDYAVFWLHPDILPLKVTSLGKTNDHVIRLPRRTINSFKRSVPVIAFSRGLFQGNENVTDVILHSGIAGIPEGAFRGCTNLARITIPKQIGYIAEGTFEGCTNLTDIYYEGTPEEWKNVKIVHDKHETVFGKLIPGTPVQTIAEERWIHVPGNDALLTSNIHFRCDLGPEAIQYISIRAGGKDITGFLENK